MEAVEELAKEGINVDHIGLATVWPIDEELILESAKKTNRVMVVEEHYVKGGLSSIVLEMLNENNVHVPVKAHGIPHDYASNGSYGELMNYYKLDAEGIKSTIECFIKED